MAPIKKCHTKKVMKLIVLYSFMQLQKKKKSNEVMAYSYSHLYNINTIGLRFFTVYGPWGRPDMALFKFTKNILAGKKIDVYNHGNHSRDFTYIDDIVDAIFLLINRKEKK